VTDPLFWQGFGWGAAVGMIGALVLFLWAVGFAKRLRGKK